MTEKAKEVLRDCKAALDLLEGVSDSQSWRIYWAAAVALVRAVGHVLYKVDVADHADKQEIVERRFRSWKQENEEHLIFREFIEKERNSLLKEYHSAVHPSSEIGLAVSAPIEPTNDRPIQTIEDIAFIDENIYRPMIEGAYEGTDARDVLSEAIEWWDYQLNSIDQEFCAFSNNKNK